MIVICNGDRVDGGGKEEGEEEREIERKEGREEEGKEEKRQASDQLTRSNKERRILLSTSVFKV